MSAIPLFAETPVDVIRNELEQTLQLQREAYLALGSQCWYVLAAGIAQPDEVPPECGVLLAHDGGLEVARPAPRRALRLACGTWLALARASAEPGPEGDEQGLL